MSSLSLQENTLTKIGNKQASGGGKLEELKGQLKELEDQLENLKFELNTKLNSGSFAGIHDSRLKSLNNKISEQQQKINEIEREITSIKDIEIATRLDNIIELLQTYNMEEWEKLKDFSKIQELYDQIGVDLSNQITLDDLMLLDLSLDEFDTYIVNIMGELNKIKRQIRDKLRIKYETLVSLKEDAQALKAQQKAKKLSEERDALLAKKLSEELDNSTNGQNITHQPPNNGEIMINIYGIQNSDIRRKIIGEFMNNKQTGQPLPFRDFIETKYQVYESSNNGRYSTFEEYCRYN